MSIKINIFSIPPFIVSILILLLGSFVYIKNKKASPNKAYLLLCLTVFLWLFSDSIVFSFVKEGQLLNFWTRLVLLGVTFIPVTFYHFVVTLLKLNKHRNILRAIYLIGLLFIFLLFFTNLYISGYNKFFWGYYPKAGAIFYLDLLFYSLLWSAALILLYMGMKSKDISMQQRNKIKYVLVAFFIGGLACIDYIANYGYPVYPFGYIFVFIMLVVFAYAIIRHRLLDIDVILKKTLIFGVLFTAVYTVFIAFTFLGQAFFEQFVTHNRWVSMMPSVLVVTIMLRPLENFLASITDKYLFQKKYDYKSLLKIFTSEVLTVLELDKLINLTKDKLIEIMKIRSCDIVLGDTAMAGEVNIPITVKNETIGTLVLGRKKSDEDYKQDDLDILHPLAKTLGLAISNAKLFEELVKTRAEVAQRDKMATIGTLAAGMAHEIRNPITTIRNFADFLPDKYNDEEFINKFEKLIPREIDRIEGIARSLLEFSSTEDAGSKEDIALDEPVKTVISILEPQYRTTEIKIICNDKEKHFIKGSRAQVQDAFFNILNFILAESQTGSNIIIECAEGEGVTSLFMRNKELFVADHIIKDVFEPISGLYKEKRGFGFNLFVAKQLLERNNATLKINSDKTTGSEFRIDFKSASGRP